MTDKSAARGLDYGAAILKLREERGMTREALAEASGVSPSYLSEVERGLKRPSTDVLAKLAEAFGMLPSQLLEHVESLSGTIRSGAVAALLSPYERGKLAAAFDSSRLWARAESRVEGEALAELLSLIGQLDDEDLKILLSLARRLRRRAR